jgi:DNA-binding transcriptional ArsR family regulator
MQSLVALADPTRRRIVEMLAVRDRTAGEIVQAFDMTAPAISQHLKVLRDARLVNVRPEGQHRIHSIDPAGLDEIEAWLRKTKRLWEKRLDALEAALRAEDERNEKKKGGQKGKRRSSG